MRRALAQLAGQIRFFVIAFVKRGIAPGMLIYLERWGAMHKKKRGEGETHRAFLLRLAEGKDDEAYTLLLRLSDCLDRLFYNGEKANFGRDDIKTLRKIFSV